MEKQRFGGDKKVGQSILHGPEKALVAWGTPKIPQWLETYHLTLLTLVWSGLNVVFGYLAQSNLHWLWMVSGMIVLQYITDVYDGAIGRLRGTGLIKWGFFMDHFLDYVFLCSLVMAGFFISPKGLEFWYLILLIIIGSFMVNSFLSFAATNQFQIYFFGFGPTEMRIVFILINTVIIFTGTAHFRYSVPLICGMCFLALIFTVYRSQKILWQLDMEALRKSEE